MTDEDMELTHGIVVAVNHLGHFLIEWPPRGRRKKWQREKETEAQRAEEDAIARDRYDRARMVQRPDFPEVAP